MIVSLSLLETDFRTYRISSIGTRAFYKFQVSCWQALYSRARSIRGRGLFLSASQLLNFSANIITLSLKVLIIMFSFLFIQHTMSDSFTKKTVAAPHTSVKIVSN